LTPFLWIGIALLIEIVFHVSEFYVPAPAHELDPPFYSSCQEPNLEAPRENAALVMLARNSEVHQAKKTIDSIERRFNRWFQYPIIFLNNEPWSDEFIATLSAATNATTTFEVIPPESWTYPSWLSEDVAKASIAEQERHGVLYGGLETYHHMCRFFSGYV
jgi:mannosyltransferase